MAYTPPTLVNSYTSTYTSGASPKTVSVTTQAGDVVVVYGGCANGSGAFGAISGNSISWTQQQLVDIDTNWAEAVIWTGTDATGGTNWTLSVAHSNSLHYGVTALVFRGSDGIGASNSTSTTGAPSLGLTTTQDNSAIVVINSDWDADDGSLRTWLTVNSITPTSGNGLEITYVQDGSSYTVYGAYWNDAGTAGSKTVGLSAPNAQKYSIAAVEVKGTTYVDPAIPLMWWGA